MPTLPQTIDGYTADWFTENLGYRVDEAKLIEKHEGTTARAKFALKGDKALPATIFLKIPPSDEAQKQFVKAVGMGYTEVGFYKQLANEIPVRVPKSYFATFENDNFVMVLEDLDASGCKYPDPNDKDILFRIQNIIEQLAAMHIKYWQSKRFQDQGDLAWLAMHGTGSPDGGVGFIKMAVDTISKDMPDYFNKIADFYLENALSIVQLWNQEPKTLTHGDVHFNNLFIDVKYGNCTGFLDWALLSHASGMRDISYVLANSVPIEVRRQHDKKWIEFYCSLLKKANIDYSFKQAWDQYRLFALYAWVAATASASMGAKWQPIEVNLASTKRATDTCEQIDSLGLIKSLL